MHLSSVRRWLPLSYAAIALLAALALGAVLLTVLRGYYLQRELEYLVGNARAIDDVAARMIVLGVSPPALESQLRSLGFLSQTRVRLYDRAEQMLADSGDPQAQYDLVMLSMLQLPAYQQTVTQTFSTEDYRSVIAVRDTLSGEEVRETSVITVTGSAGPSLGEGALLDELGLISYLPAVGTPYGFGFDLEAVSQRTRSAQMVRQPLYGVDGALVGYVELAEGPAYGRQILERVAWGWSMAGGVAVLLATVVGWLISRRITHPLSQLTQVTALMSEGDLSARAAVDRQDEFGTLARSFNQMAARVEATVLTLRRFVADAAHELRTPLTALRTNLELASGDVFVRQAQHQVERLERLTASLLSLSRLEAGERDQLLEPLVLNPIVRAAAELYASQAEQLGLAFESDVPADAVVITGDATQLGEALGNLLDNALKFTPQGGTVTLSLSTEEGWAFIRVCDTGIGIPAEDLPHLFDRFHRGSRAAQYAGSGLGLAIVHAIASHHNGTIEVDQAAQGTQLTLRLPLR